MREKGFDREVEREKIKGREGGKDKKM